MRKFMFRGPAAILVIILSLCFIGLFMINGCRKTDRSAKRTETESAIRSNFFTILPGTDPVVTAIAASVKRQDRHRDFIPGLVQKAGFALWNQARVVAKNKKDQSTAGREAGPEQLILIPFAPANEGQTKAILFVRLSATDTLYHLLYGSQYRQYGFDPANSGWNAKDVFHAFLLFDKAIFGHTQFNITDPRLLTDSTAPAGDPAILEITGISSPFNRSYYEETVCIDYTVCHRCLPFRGVATNSQSDPCCFREDYTTCITYWFDDDDWGWYNPGGGDPGGGGGGSGGGFENEEPCNDPNEPATGFCNPGWEPVVEPLNEMVTIASVRDSLTNPCLITARSKLSVDQIRAFIGNFRISPAPTQNVNIVYVENPNLDDATFAESYLFNGEWRIELNTRMFNGVLLDSISLELTVNILLHEVLHGYIRVYKDILGVTQLSNFTTHLYIFQNLIIHARDILMGLFPSLSQFDATALALTGLDDVLELEYNQTTNALSNYKQEYDTYSQNNYGISIPQMDSVYSLYLFSLKGTKCR